eukprot:g6296.t1
MVYLPSAWQSLLTAALTCGSDYSCASATDTVLPDEVCSLGTCTDADCCETAAALTCGTDYFCASATDTVLPDAVCSLGTCTDAECCEPALTCGSDYSCASATDTVLPDEVCSFGTCNDADCCEPALTCGSDYSCASTTDTVLPDAVCSLGTCADVDCCEPALTCGSYYSCASATDTVLPDAMCSLGTCTDADCCEPALTCGSYYSCASATDTVLPDAVCSLGTCTDADCCEPALTCGSDYSCASATDTVLPDTVCSLGTCTDVECCEPALTCGSDYSCAATTDTVLPDAVCGLGTCTDADCCEPAAALTCGSDYSCASAMDTVLPDAVCSLGACTDTDCCEAAAALTCGSDHSCASVTDTVLPDAVCSLGTCTDADCCEPAAALTCGPEYPCTSATDTVLPDAVCSLGTCTDADCCEPAAALTCGSDYSCASATDTVLPDAVCSLGTCTDADCCEPAAALTCGSDYSCASATDTVLPDAVCSLGTCTDADCCEPAAALTCGSDYSCASATDTVLPDAVCSLGTCTDADCCEPAAALTCGSDYSCASATDTVLPDAVCSLGTCTDADCCEPAIVPPGASPAPGATTAPVSSRELQTSSPTAFGVDEDEIERPGTVAAGAVSLLAVVGILVVSTGSIIRSNQGNSSGTSDHRSGTSGGGSGTTGGGPEGSSGANSRGFPGMLVTLGGSSGGDTASRASKRRPSATLAVVLMTQLQFLATLSLVDSAVREDSWLGDFVVGLRWINLWWSTKIGEDIGSEECVFEAGASEIGASVFVGNLVLVLGILVGVFVLHILIVSGVEAHWLTKNRARENLESARLRATPAGELHAWYRGGKVLHRTTPGLDGASPFASQDSQVSPTLTPDDEFEANSNDEEEGRGQGLVPVRGESWLNPVAECREQSTSVWLHFPHVELIVLFFAFEGAVASFASAMRHSECVEIFYTASAAMALYPLLMVVAVFRTLWVRIFPGVILIFKPHDNDHSAPNSRGGFWSRFKSSWAEDYSLFSWADKGQWETVRTESQLLRREGDRFRIGFEPVFVDYTKRGTWFVMISLVEWTSIALVGVLIDDSVVQLLAFCGVHMVMFAILVCFKPFANSIINNIGAGVMVMDAVCMGLLAAAATVWEGTSKERHVSTAVVALQLITLSVLVVPVYLDAVTIVVGAIRNRLRKTLDKAGQKVRDTSEGVRRPRFSTAARSGPNPLREPADPTDDGHSRRQSFNVIGTVNTPLVVHNSGRLKEAGSGSSARGVIPTTLSRVDGEQATERRATALFNGMSDVESAASGKELIKQGVHSSAPKLPSPRASLPQVFDVVEPHAIASFAGKSEAEVGASGRGEVPQKGFHGAMFSSKGDGASSERGSTKRGLSGREIIRHGKSNEYEHDNLPPSEGMKAVTDDISGAVRGAGGEGSRGELVSTGLASHSSVENDVPERRGVVLGATAGAAAVGSFSSKALSDSATYFDDGQPDGDGVHRNIGRHKRGLPRLSWGECGPTEVDVPQRRSDYISEHPTESRSSHAPARDRSSGGSDALVQNDEHEDSSRHDDGDVGDVAIEEGGDLAGSDVSASHRSNKRGGVGGWGVKSRAPVADELPRRRSGGFVDASAHSMENASVAAGPFQQVFADECRADDDDSVGDQRGASKGSKIRESAIFAGLAGLNRGPVESDLPRRRRSSEISLPEQGAVRPMEDVSSRGGDGTGGTCAFDDETVSDLSTSASRGLSSRVSVSGGWRSGLKRKVPVIIDIPRRSSGYSVDGSAHSVDGPGVAGGDSLRLQHRAKAKDGVVAHEGTSQYAGKEDSDLGGGGTSLDAGQGSGVSIESPVREES